MNEHGSPFEVPVTIDHHIHYVASSGKCRPAVVIDAGQGDVIAFLLAFTTPDEGHTVWHKDCQHDEEMKMPGTWHIADCADTLEAV
jgi:hypothetical protein